MAANPFVEQPAFFVEIIYLRAVSAIYSIYQWVGLGIRRVVWFREGIEL